MKLFKAQVFLLSFLVAVLILMVLCFTLGSYKVEKRKSDSEYFPAPQNVTSERDSKFVSMDTNVTTLTKDESDINSAERNANGTKVAREDSDIKSSGGSTNVTILTKDNDDIKSSKRSIMNVVVVNASKADFSISQEKKLPPGIKEFPSALRFASTVDEAFGKLSVKRIESFITFFSKFHDRYYDSKDGLEAAEWLISEITDSVNTYRNYSGNVTIQRFIHSWKQPSVIVRLEGRDPTLRSQFVLLGAHLDTEKSPGESPVPGADDNASGCSVLLECLRALLETNFIPKRTLEFQFYAAGEAGRLGSQEIAKCYSSSGVNVFSMLNFDRAGHFEPRNWKSALGFLVKNQSEVKVPLKVLIHRLCSLRFGILFGFRQDVECGAKCISDEASWAAFDIPVAWPTVIRKVYYGFDDIEHVNFEGVKKFVMIATAYSIEIAQPYI